MQLSIFFSIFLLCFWNLHNILNIFKQIWPSYYMYFRNYRLQKTWFDKYLKSPTWEHPSTVNIVKSSKHLWNMNESTFVILFRLSGEILNIFRKLMALIAYVFPKLQIVKEVVR